MNIAGPVYVIIALLAVVTITIIYLIKTKHLERMAKIESGMIDPDQKSSGAILVNAAILFFSLAAGIFVSYLFSANTNIPDYIIIPGFLFLFGGIGFTVSYTFTKKMGN